MNKRSFDLIGDIAVIETESKAQERALAKKILSLYPKVKLILRKGSRIEGPYRLRKYRPVFQDGKKIRSSGLKPTETIHRELGCVYKLDVAKVFFNPRDATLRKKIAQQVRPGEKVLVMFAGIGPYAILIAKVKKCEVTAIELNPAAVAYAIENIRLNRVQDRVELFQGDARAFKPGKTFDRIVMPLAAEGYRYLGTALELCRKGGTIHLLGVGPKESPLKALEKEIAKVSGKARADCRILGSFPVRTYAPGLTEVCVTLRSA